MADEFLMLRTCLGDGDRGVPGTGTSWARTDDEVCEGCGVGPGGDISWTSPPVQNEYECHHDSRGCGHQRQCAMPGRRRRARHQPRNIHGGMGGEAPRQRSPAARSC